MGRRERLLRGIYERKRLGSAIYVFSASVSLLVAAVFVIYLAYLVIFERDLKEVLELVFATGVPFVAVGAARHLIGAKRPYEVYPFYEECPKRRFFGRASEEKGSASFPSRHAYSAFAISTVMLFAVPWCGIVLAVLGALMCAARVLLGIHFVRDVLAGAVIGVTAGVLGEFLLNF